MERFLQTIPSESVLPEGHPGRLAARQVLQDLYGQPVLEVGMGGSIPVLETFQSLLGLETVLFSFAVGDENIHAPNEFFRIPRLAQGQEGWARLLWTLGQPGVVAGKQPAQPSARPEPERA